MKPDLLPIAHSRILKASEGSHLVLNLFGFFKPKEAIPIAFRQGVYWALENYDQLVKLKDEQEKQAKA